LIGSDWDWEELRGTETQLRGGSGQLQLQAVKRTRWVGWPSLIILAGEWAQEGSIWKQTADQEWAFGFLEGSSQKPALIPECQGFKIDLQLPGGQVGVLEGSQGDREQSTAGEVGRGVRGALAFKERTRETCYRS